MNIWVGLRKVLKSHYIVMGDFNDGPSSKVYKPWMSRNNLHNPMETFKIHQIGGAFNYRKAWRPIWSNYRFPYLLQLMKRETIAFAGIIFDETFLTEFKGKYKGNHIELCWRRYMGGFGDHFLFIYNFKSIPSYLKLKGTFHVVFWLFTTKLRHFIE